jgi:hypothetical protein
MTTDSKGHKLALVSRDARPLSCGKMGRFAGALANVFHVCIEPAVGGYNDNGRTGMPSAARCSWCYTIPTDLNIASADIPASGQ